MKNALKIAKCLGIGKLAAGTSPETSGGLLIAIPADNAEKFCLKIQEIESCPAWIVGRVIQGDRGAELIENPEFLEISYRLDC